MMKMNGRPDSSTKSSTAGSASRSSVVGRVGSRIKSARRMTSPKKG